jgi:hypothetical protein
MKSAVVFAIALLALPACGCKSKSEGGGGTGPDKPLVGDPKKCDEARPGVEALYRAEPDTLPPAKAGADPEAAKRLTEQLIGDNVDMVMKDCKADPARVAPCIRAATSVRQLERDCLPALDEEGSEGSAFGK